MALMVMPMRMMHVAIVMAVLGILALGMGMVVHTVPVLYFTHPPRIAQTFWLAVLRFRVAAAAPLPGLGKSSKTAQAGIPFEAQGKPVLP